MFKSKYSTVLTIFLVILIIAIIIIAIMMGIKAYRNYEDEKENRRVIAEFQEQNRIETNEIENNVIDENILNETIGTNSVENNITGGGSTTSRPKTKFYKEYPMIGTIKIEKTKVDYPILLDVSPGALEVAVGVMYPNNPKLNEPGNVVIIGHNYRNGKFFSNNKNLVIGDKIKITDLTGRTLTYTIYEINQTTETDTEYITRDRGGSTEISLSTCTDDGKGRLVILAKVE